MPAWFWWQVWSLLTAGILGRHTEVSQGGPEARRFYRGSRGEQRGDQQLGRRADRQWETRCHELIVQRPESLLSFCFLALGKIKDLLKPGTVTPMTRLALVNAIYFKGNWLHRFDDANTKEMPFKVNKVKTKIVSGWSKCSLMPAGAE